MATPKRTMVVDKATMEATRGIVGTAKDTVVEAVVALAAVGAEAAAAATMATISPPLKL
jgi:hypothetical protein